MKNLKKILAVVLSVMIVFSVVGCGQKEEAQEAAKTKLEQIKESGQLVIGTSASYPPYEFHKQIDGKDQIVGFDIEIAKEIASDLGVELVIKDMKFEGLLAALNTGKIDMVIAGMTPTEERKKSVDFSKVYYVATQSVIVKADQVENFKTPEDLKDKMIGVQKGTLQEEIAKGVVPADQIKGLGKVADVILELKGDKVDAIIVESPVGKAYAKNNDDLGVAEIDFNTGDSGSAIAIKKGSTDFVAAVDATLDRLMNDEKIDEFVAAATELADN
ncbi:amino acid ABC transporter substrate-binding protein, PAAT family (TC 3.A.1.3.-) [Peptoclostridium litorale DSM 5388]|uniref:Arginine-binding extracellular protein ArtP n=1 Tax=Peptoclostridium litorale DSM 5388 TaxID=1121324 RepID=A0A069RPA6_PEPLI|nr:transporter substrate-binding domain-containing protein [Peptoclostridium litorale]KDR96007.1 arginine-binding extracellular protein ArtP [Peptoclostridium litorale DSM 5388]SIO06775.1 amino acid ABC transporter substrate-binding protein, PAAT family (TC 3.A.1.3.-) [Peptoclostridium litorale DSM 5388]